MKKTKMMKNQEKSNDFFKSIIQALLITFVVCFVVFPFSCKITPEGIDIIGGDYSPPVLNEITVIDSHTVTVSFSEEVVLKGSIISPFIKDVSDSNEHSSGMELSPALDAAGGGFGALDASFEYLENNTVLKFNIEEGTKTGKTYEIYGIVEDSIGNTLTFCVPFSGYNEKVAKMIMTEIRTCTDSASDKREYVEFLVVEEGNLAGLEVRFGGGEKYNYDFGAYDVNKGDIITLHTEKGSNDVSDEDSDKLDLCTHSDANDNARDLWCENTKGIIGNNDDIIVLYNLVDKTVMDAVMFRQEKTTAWSKTKQELADFIDDAGIYDSGCIDNASFTKGGDAVVGTSYKHPLHRVDAFRIYEKVLRGECIELPLQSEQSSWKIVKNSCSPGAVFQLQ